MGCECLHSSLNKFFAILMTNILSYGQIENYFLHLTHWPLKIVKTQIKIN